MKILLVLFISFMIILPILANDKLIKQQNILEGSFKKKHNGTFAQYNEKGKQIGLYKIKNGKIVRIK